LHLSILKGMFGGSDRRYIYHYIRCISRSLLTVWTVWKKTTWWTTCWQIRYGISSHFVRMH